MYEEIIDRGVALNDAMQAPDWVHRIDPDRLKMEVAYACVWGQLYEPFTEQRVKQKHPILPYGPYGFYVGEKSAIDFRDQHPEVSIKIRRNWDEVDTTYYGFVCPLPAQTGENAYRDNMQSFTREWADRIRQLQQERPRPETLSPVRFYTKHGVIELP